MQDEDNEIIVKQCEEFIETIPQRIQDKIEAHKSVKGTFLNPKISEKVLIEREISAIVRDFYEFNKNIFISHWNSIFISFIKKIPKNMKGIAISSYFDKIVVDENSFKIFKIIINNEELKFSKKEIIHYTCRMFTHFDIDDKRLNSILDEYYSDIKKEKSSLIYFMKEMFTASSLHRNEMLSKCSEQMLKDITLSDIFTKGNLFEIFDLKKTTDSVKNNLSMENFDFIVYLFRIKSSYTTEEIIKNLTIFDELFHSRYTESLGYEILLQMLNQDKSIHKILPEIVKKLPNESISTFYSNLGNAIVTKFLNKENIDEKNDFFKKEYQNILIEHTDIDLLSKYIMKNIGREDVVISFMKKLSIQTAACLILQLELEKQNRELKNIHASINNIIQRYLETEISELNIEDFTIEMLLLVNLNRMYVSETTAKKYNQMLKGFFKIIFDKLSFLECEKAILIICKQEIKILLELVPDRFFYKMQILEIQQHYEVAKYFLHQINMNEFKKLPQIDCDTFFKLLPIQGDKYAFIIRFFQVNPNFINTLNEKQILQIVNNIELQIVNNIEVNKIYLIIKDIAKNQLTKNVIIKSLKILRNVSEREQDNIMTLLNMSVDEIFSVKKQISRDIFSWVGLIPKLSEERQQLEIKELLQNETQPLNQKEHVFHAIYCNTYNEAIKKFLKEYFLVQFEQIRKRERKKYNTDDNEQYSLICEMIQKDIEYIYGHMIRSKDREFICDNIAVILNAMHSEHASKILSILILQEEKNKTKFEIKFEFIKPVLDRMVPCVKHQFIFFILEHADLKSEIEPEIEKFLLAKTIPLANIEGEIVDRGILPSFKVEFIGKLITLQDENINKLVDKCCMLLLKESDLFNVFKGKGMYLLSAFHTNFQNAQDKYDTINANKYKRQEKEVKLTSDTLFEIIKTIKEETDLIETIEYVIEKYLEKYPDRKEEIMHLKRLKVESKISLYASSFKEIKPIKYKDISSYALYV